MMGRSQRLYSLGYSGGHLANSQFRCVLLGLFRMSRFGIRLVNLLRGTTRR
jgi:hypothetical protein